MPRLYNQCEVSRWLGWVWLPTLPFVSGYTKSTNKTLPASLALFLMHTAVSSACDAAIADSTASRPTVAR